MTISSLSSLQATPNQRSGATVKAILTDGRIIAEIEKGDALALKKLQTKLQGLTEKHPQLKESEAHVFLHDTLGDETCDRFVLLSPDRTKVSGAMSFTTERLSLDKSDNRKKSYLVGLASVKAGGGKGLIAYLLDTCFKQGEHKGIELHSLSDNNHSSFLNGQEKPSKAVTVLRKFGFHPLDSDTSPGEGGTFTIIRKDLTTYAHDAIKDLKTKDLPDSFVLSHDLTLDDGNKFS
jgi:hypothetical protein